MKTKKPLTVMDAIKYLTLYDPDLTSLQIQDRLKWLGLDSCTTFLISIRRSFRDDMRFLKKIGMLSDNAPEIPVQIRRLKKPKHEPPRYHFFGQQPCDDD